MEVSLDEPTDNQKDDIKEKEDEERLLTAEKSGSPEVKKVSFNFLIELYILWNKKVYQNLVCHKLYLFWYYNSFFIIVAT